MNDIGSAIGIIAALAAVFWLTWITTKFVARKSGLKQAGRMMRVVDRLSLGGDRSLLLVKIGTEYCVIGIAGHSMTFIKSLNTVESETEETEAEQPQSETWAAAAGAGFSRGVQTFAERLGMAMRRPSGKPRVEMTQENEPKAPKAPDALDEMNERITLRKESRWRKG